MISKSAFALTAAVTLVLGTAALSGATRSFTLVNYPACVENPSGADCLKGQEGSQRSAVGHHAAIPERYRRNGA
jgi:hypothetical protein